MEWLVQSLTPSGNHKAISFSALSTASDPWQIFLPTSTAKSPRMVPDNEHDGIRDIHNDYDDDEEEEDKTWG